MKNQNGEDVQPSKGKSADKRGQVIYLGKLVTMYCRSEQK